MPIPSPDSKVTAFAKRVCKNDPMQEGKFFNFWGEKGKEGGITLLLFTNWTQKTPNKQTKKASEKVTTQGLVHLTAWFAVTKTA